MLDLLDSVMFLREGGFSSKSAFPYIHKPRRNMLIKRVDLEIVRVGGVQGPMPRLFFIPCLTINSRTTDLQGLGLNMRALIHISLDAREPTWVSTGHIDP